MADKLIPLKLPPGFVNNGTQYQSKGRWLKGNLVRFFQDTIQPIGGWAQRTLDGATISGVPTGAHAWVLDVTGATQYPVLAIGTTAGLYLLQGKTVYDITPAEVTTAGSNANRVWQLDNFGVYLVAVAYDHTDYRNRGHLYVWKGDPTALAINATSQPLYPTSVVATQEHFLFVLGGTTPEAWEYGPYGYPPPPNIRTVFWADRETYSDFLPSATNTAGDFPLATQGALLCGRRVRGGILLLTTTDAYLATYIGGDLIYRFDPAGIDCGAVSTRALVGLDTEAYWMGEKGFFVYNGFTSALPCEVHDYVFGNFNAAYRHKVWAFSNPQFGEITWFYPSANATEIDSYVTYSHREKHWVFGSMVRTAGVNCQSKASGSSSIGAAAPVLLGSDGKVYDHETGSARESIVPYLESGPAEVGDGDRFMALTRMLPDEKNAGDVLLTIFASPYPNAAETSYGPFGMANPVDLRLEARQVRVRLEGYSTAVGITTEPSPYVYTPGMSMGAFSPARTGVARFVQNTSLAADETYPMPVHSGTWQVGVIRFGAKPSSMR